MERIRPSILKRPLMPYSRKNVETQEEEYRRNCARLETLKLKRQAAESFILENIRPEGASEETKRERREAMRAEISRRELVKRLQRTKHHGVRREGVAAVPEEENDPRGAASREYSRNVRLENKQLAEYRKELKLKAREKEIEEDRARNAKDGMHAYLGKSLQ